MKPAIYAILNDGSAIKVECGLKSTEAKRIAKIIFSEKPLAAVNVIR